MSNRFGERLIRFALTLLVAGFLVRLLASAVPHDLASPVADRLQKPLADVLSGGLLESAGLLVRGLGLALPLSLLAGWLIRRGGSAGLVVKALARALNGVPFVAVIFLCLYVLLFRLDLAPFTVIAYVAMAIGLWPTFTLAIARGLNPALPPLRQTAAVVGALLGQAGNATVAALVAGLFMIPSRGSLELLVQGVRLGDPVVLYQILSVGLFVLLACHLAGDLLELWAGEPAPEAPTASTWQLGAGLALASLLVAMAVLSGEARAVAAAGKFVPPGDSLLLGTDQAGRELLQLLGPGTRLSLALVGGAALVSLIAGGVLAVSGRQAGAEWGALLTPRFPMWSPWAPLAGALVILPLAGHTPLVLGAVLAVAGIPAMAHHLRRPAALSTTGALLLLASQNLTVEMTLGGLGIGLPSSIVSLGTLVRGGLMMGHAPHLLYPALLGALGVAGLSLTGWTLLGAAPPSEGN